MYGDERIELRVGLFIGIGVFIMFMIVFSIKDVSLLGKGYSVDVLFDYVNGLTEDSPVRLAGVNVGNVRMVDLFYDDEKGKTRVKLGLWLKSGTRIEEDAVARVNSLGLLGEQYLEIDPGKSKNFVKDGDVLSGQNPLSVGEQMADVHKLVKSLGNIAGSVERGEGTLGKFIMDDTLYNDLTSISGRLNRGEGTIGKLLVKEDIYNNLDGFVSDIKAHPWKLLHKPKSGSGKGKDNK